MYLKKGYYKYHSDITYITHVLSSLIFCKVITTSPDELVQILNAEKKIINAARWYKQMNETKN